MSAEGPTAEGQPRGSFRRSALLLGSAVLIAFVGAVCGIGGGLFAVPLLHYGFKLSLRSSVATGLCLVAANAVASTVSESMHVESALLWDIVGPLVGGALVGAQFGYLASKRLNERALKGIFSVVLLGIGIRMLLAVSVPASPGDVYESYGVGAAMWVAGIGFLAGTLSPLLGIGGGLVVVPGLLLTMPEVGGNGARAASLAAACVTSLRSVHLYSRERAVDLTAAPFLVIGGFLGAALGVQFAHLPGGFCGGAKGPRFGASGHRRALCHRRAPVRWLVWDPRIPIVTKPHSDAQQDAMIKKIMVDMQERIAFQEHTLEKLNRVVADQQLELDSIQREVVELRAAARLGNEAKGEETRSLEDDRPPHY